MFLRALLAFLALPGIVAFAVPIWWIAATHAELDSRWGLLPLVIGSAALLWCVRDFYVFGKGTLAPWSPPQHLVTSGLYRYSRNPMYVSVTAVVIGQAALFGDWRLLVYGAVFWLACHLFVMGYEEPTLARTFGDEYERFRANVPRWIPRLTPWHASRTDASTR